MMGIQVDSDRRLPFIPTQSGSMPTSGPSQFIIHYDDYDDDNDDNGNENDILDTTSIWLIYDERGFDLDCTDVFLKTARISVPPPHKVHIKSEFMQSQCT